MKANLFIFLLTLALTGRLAAQQKCSSAEYLQNALNSDPSLRQRVADIEAFSGAVQEQRIHSSIQDNVIKIPVVVHVLYHNPEEKLSDARINGQIEALNKYFRRRNNDTTNTPAYFRQLAADCEIEFQLATQDPRGRSTSGIIRKYTPITKWKNDDKMKFSSEMGDDAWDARSYLNIWVCNLDRFAGYATVPGAALNIDGVVIGHTAFGTSGANTAYDLGKTAVHEIGHWLNLKHIWGDANCGDDGVADTPKQASYTVGCPSTVRITCGNGPYGDMYMNYMDYTNDACINMFTQGQKARMRTLFATGGARRSLLSSKGLNPPLIQESPLPEDEPRWLQVKLYPNPAVSELILDLSYDARWIGKNLFVTNLHGQNVMNLIVTSKKQSINVAQLPPGIYFIAAKKDDGESIKQRFIKL